MRPLQESRRLAAAVIVLAVLLGPLPATTAARATEPTSTDDETPGDRYDAMLTGNFPPDEPGAVAIVARGGKILYRGASGMASLEMDVALESDMVFEIGSITKQFTAAAIMMLAEQGKLSVDDPLSKFLPDYPAGDNVTVEHLLTHTSGIVSYTGIPGYMDSRVRKDLSVEELVAVFKDLPVEFDPGTRFRYNNSGYVLLGAVIEAASGMTYEDFVEEKIFAPAGMSSSSYGSSTEVVPRRASGYESGEGTFRNARFLSMTQPYAAGSLMSTVDDLLRWNTALFSGKVVSEATLAKMTTAYILSDGESTGYGYGLGIGDIRGHAAIRHGGGIFGFETHGIYLPGEDVYVAVLANRAGAGHDPGPVATRMAALAAGDPFTEFTRVDIPVDVLKRYVGVYEIDAETTRNVVLEDGSLYTQRSGGPRLEATPASETTFFYDGTVTWFEFVTDASGKVTGMGVHQDGSKNAKVAKKIVESVPEHQVARVDPAIYDDYVGEYELAPGFILTVTREGDRLMTQATGQAQVEVFPSSETEFFLKVVDATLTFVRGDDGAVHELVLHQAGRDVTGKRK